MELKITTNLIIQHGYKDISFNNSIIYYHPYSHKRSTRRSWRKHLKSFLESHVRQNIAKIYFYRDETKSCQISGR